MKELKEETNLTKIISLHDMRIESYPRRYYIIVESQLSSHIYD